jgi:hypothetical protein
VFVRYEELTGIRISPLWIVDSVNFVKRRHLVGSYVLSELARQGSLTSLRPKLTSAIGPANATFLDGTAVMIGSNRHRLSDIAGQNSFRHLPTNGCLCQVTINQAFQECDPTYCGHSLPNEPNANMFRYQFK